METRDGAGDQFSLSAIKVVIFVASPSRKPKSQKTLKTSQSERRSEKQDESAVRVSEEALDRSWMEASIESDVDDHGSEKPVEKGALGLHSLLKENFEADAPAAAEDPDDPAVHTAPKQEDHNSHWWSKVVKSAIGLLVVIGVGWQPMQRLFQVSSVEAVVNARLVTLRAPIPGIVQSVGSNARVGERTQPGQSMIVLANPRADRTRLDDLERMMARTEDDRAPLENRLNKLRVMSAQLTSQTEQFRYGRMRQIEMRVKAFDAEIKGALAQHEAAEAKLARFSTLNEKGVVPAASLEPVERDAIVTKNRVETIRARKDAALVELDAIRNGSFVGDSYNDRPSSQQRLDQLKQKIVFQESELGKLNLRRARLKKALIKEQTRSERLSRAIINAPANGRIWEILVAPGEQVAFGQDVLRILDCSGAVVTATVSEAVYNSLSVGMDAGFRFREGGAELRGHVVQLTGVASAPANLAILPSALIKESYRVMVAIPELASDKKCNVGRTGRVVFQERGTLSK